MATQKRISQLLCGLAFGLLQVACTPQVDSPTPPQPAPAATAAAEGLRLTAQSQDRVAGELLQGGVTLRFAAADNGSSGELTLLDGANQVLLQAQRGGESSLSILSGALHMQASSAQGLAAEQVAQSGDSAAAARLNARPEMKLLPTLSKLLGERGINGRDYPATYPLHLLASRIADMADSSLGESQSQLSPDVLACKDLRKDPNKNECYGMCGRGCSCWSWVCGDCCYHRGCAYHDTQCRTCSLTHPVACNLCYVDFVKAFAIGGGCAS